MGTRINGAVKGKTAERDVANYLKAHGIETARRSVSTGTIHTPDRGDIDGVPGFAIQVKNLARRLEGKLLADVWHDACRQSVAMAQQTPAFGAPTCCPVIIEKRAGSADVGRWWLHLGALEYVRMITGRWSFIMVPHLVRVEVGDIIGDWVSWVRELERAEG